MIIVTPFVVKNLPDYIYKSEESWVSKNHLALEILFQLFSGILFFLNLFLMSTINKGLQIKWKAK